MSIYKNGQKVLGSIVTIDDNRIKEVANTYSTNEMVIGKWIDGKPIYRKVIRTNTPTKANTTTVVLSLENTVSDIIRTDGFIVVGSGSSKGYVPVNGSIIDNTTFKGAWCSANEVYMSVSEYYINKQVTLILEYTKTTDA